jgi:membrane protein implicated in regulation of membrane protease activity
LTGNRIFDMLLVQKSSKEGKPMNPAIFIWLVLLIGFLVVEAACPIHLVSIWFAAGALAAMIAAALGAQFWLQITIFVVVSA